MYFSTLLSVSFVTGYRLFCDCYKPPVCEDKVEFDPGEDIDGLYFTLSEENKTP